MFGAVSARALLYPSAHIAAMPLLLGLFASVLDLYNLDNRSASAASSTLRLADYVPCVLRDHRRFAASLQGLVVRCGSRRGRVDSPGRI